MRERNWVNPVCTGTLEKKIQKKGMYQQNRDHILRPELALGVTTVREQASEWVRNKYWSSISRFKKIGKALFKVHLNPDVPIVLYVEHLSNVLNI